MYGYTISAFMAARNLDITLIGYGPMILAACSGLIIALAMVTVKYLRSRIAFCHINILLAASVLHFIASFFYFVKDYGKCFTKIPAFLISTLLFQIMWVPLFPTWLTALRLQLVSVFCILWRIKIVEPF